MTNMSGPGATPTGATSTGVTTTHGVTDDRSVSEIVGDIAKDLSTLMKQELDLAKTEMKNEATKAGKGAGFLGGAGVAGHLALIFLSLFVVFLLNRVIDLDWAALIVAVIWGVVAAVLGLKGKKDLQQVNPTLETTQRTLKEDARWAREQKNS